MHLTDPKFTSDEMFCECGGHSFVPIPWACKKHTTVSHNSTKADVIPLNIDPRMDGPFVLTLWDIVIDVL